MISTLPVPTGLPFKLIEPVKFKLPVKFILPLKLIEPVLYVFVTIASSTVGPSEPETAMNILPSVVFSANSPSCNEELLGF